MSAAVPPLPEAYPTAGELVASELAVLFDHLAAEVEAGDVTTYVDARVFPAAYRLELALGRKVANARAVRAPG